MLIEFTVESNQSQQTDTLCFETRQGGQIITALSIIINAAPEHHRRWCVVCVMVSRQISIVTF
jgi:hypothetical protein